MGAGKKKRRRFPAPPIKMSVDALRAQIKELISESPDGCWIWKGETLEGLGIFKRTTALRAVYQAFVGPVPPRKRLYHECGKTLCVYPGHLRVGPGIKSFCKYGHEFTPENTEFHGVLKDCKKCKTCHYNRCKKSRAMRSFANQSEDLNEW